MGPLTPFVPFGTIGVNGGVLLEIKRALPFYAVVLLILTLVNSYITSPHTIMPRRRNKQKTTNKPAVQGRGDYKTSVKQMGRLAKQVLPGLVGKGVAMATGLPGLEGPVSVVSHGLANLLEQIVQGRGPYENGVQMDEYSYNSLWKKAIAGKSPHFAHDNDRNYIRSRGVVPLGDVVLPASGTYSRVWPITPNLLSIEEARSFTEWKPISMFVVFETGLGMGTSGAEGLMTTYHCANPNLPSPTDYVSASRFNGAMEARFDKSTVTGIECEDSTWLMCREGTNDVTDKVNTDYGYFGVFCAPSAALANQRIGRLMLHYIVDFRYTKSNPDVFGYAHLTSTTFSSAAPLGSTVTIAQAYGTLLGITATSSVITLTNVVIGQSYLLTYSAVCGATAVVTPPTITLAGCTALNIFGAGTTNTRTGPQSGATSGNVTLMVAFTVSDTTPNTPTISFSGATLPGTPNTLDVTITPLPCSTAATLL